MAYKKTVNPPIFGSFQEDQGTFSFPGLAYVPFWVLFLTLIVACFTLGASITLIPILARIFRRRQPANRTSWFIFALVILSLLSLVFLSLGQIILFKDELTWSLQAYPTETDEAFFRQIAMLPLSIGHIRTGSHMLATTEMLLPPISDALIIFRAKTLFPSQRSVVVTTWVLWGLTGATVLLSIIIQIYRAAVPLNERPGPTPVQLAGYAAYAAITTTVVCNIVATGLIGWKVRSHYSILKDTLGEYQPVRATPAQRILIVLLESGTVYCVIQVIYFIYLTVYSFGETAPRGAPNYTPLIQFLFYVVSGLYPVVCYIILDKQRTVRSGYIDLLSSGYRKVKHENVD